MNTQKLFLKFELWKSGKKQPTIFFEAPHSFYKIGPHHHVLFEKWFLNQGVWPKHFHFQKEPDDILSRPHHLVFHYASKFHQSWLFLWFLISPLQKPLLL